MNEKHIVNICFSPNGETRRIADLFSERLGLTTIELANSITRAEFQEFQGDLLILSLPVYSQNIPLPIRDILSRLRFRFALINVTFGGYTYGNVLREVSKILGDTTIIGYSVTPVKHAYLPHTPELDSSLYNPLIDRIIGGVYTAVRLPRKIKYYPTFLEKPLTDITYRLRLNQNLCTKCGTCRDKCPTNSISNVIELPKSCIKCARCVNVCPTGALTGATCFTAKIYFLKKKRTGVIVR